MSRDFTEASNEKIRWSSTPVTAAPFSISAWMYPHDVDTENTAVAISDLSASSDYWYLNIWTDQTLLWNARRSSQGLCFSSNTATLNAWNHLFAIEASSSSRTCILNGDTANKGTNTTNVAPLGIDTFNVGLLDRSGGPNGPMEGFIAEVAIWNAALTDAEGVVLSKGVSPLMVRPQSLIFYAPIMGKLSPEPDYIGGLTGTLTGTVAASHAPVFYPGIPFLPGITAVVAPPTSVVPQAVYHHRHHNKSM